MTTTATVTNTTARIAALDSELSECRDSLVSITACAITSKEIPPGTKINEFTDLRKTANQQDLYDSKNLRRIKKRQQKIHKLTNTRKRLMAYNRKLDTRSKIELGGIVVKAGLRDTDKALLLGCLIELSEQLHDPENTHKKRLQQLRKAGSLAFSENTDNEPTT